jgi:hypothetical protein
VCQAAGIQTEISKKVQIYMTSSIQNKKEEEDKNLGSILKELSTSIKMKVNMID